MPKLAHHIKGEGTIETRESVTSCAKFFIDLEPKPFIDGHKTEHATVPG
jgi:hypothetical protein